MRSRDIARGRSRRCLRTYLLKKKIHIDLFVCTYSVSFITKYTANRIDSAMLLWNKSQEIHKSYAETYIYTNIETYKAKSPAQIATKVNRSGMVEKNGKWDAALSRICLTKNINLLNTFIIILSF